MHYQCKLQAFGVENYMCKLFFNDRNVDKRKICQPVFECFFNISLYFAIDYEVGVLLKIHDMTFPLKFFHDKKVLRIRKNRAEQRKQRKK